MGIIVKQSFITTVIMYLGAILGYINLLYLYPKFMSVDQIGIVRTMQDMAVLFVPLAQFGFNYSLVKFYPRYSNEDKGSAFFTLLLLLSFITFIVFISLFFIFKSYIFGYFETNAAEFLVFIPFVLVITFLLLIYGILTAYAQTQLQIVITNSIKDIWFRLFIVILLISYFFNWISFLEFIIGVAASYGIMVIILGTYLVLQKSLRLKFDFSFITRITIKEILTYAGYSVLGTSAMLIIGKIDSLMVTGMLGTGLNGIYTTVFFIAIIIEFPKRAITQISFPLVSKAFEKEDMKEVGSLYKQSSINQLIAGSLLLIGIWANIDSLFAIMPQGELFRTGKYVVLFVGLGRLIDMAAGINGAILVMSKHFRYNIVLLLILAIMTVVFNLIFIPEYGIIGAAIGSALALTLFNVGKYFLLWVLLKIQPFQLKTLVVLFIALISYFVSTLLPDLDFIILDIFVRSIIISIIFLSGLLIFKPSREIEELADKFFKLFRSKN